MSGYMDIVRLLGIAYKNQAISKDDYGELIAAVDRVKNSIKDHQQIITCVETLIQSRPDRIEAEKLLESIKKSI
jgi:hypothetical protein